LIRFNGKSLGHQLIGLVAAIRSVLSSRQQEGRQTAASIADNAENDSTVTTSNKKRVGDELPNVVKKAPKPLPEPIPQLPANMIGTNILPMIADRTTFNNLRSVSKEIHDCSQTLITNGKITPPWPATSVPVTSRVWSMAFSPDNGLLACGDSDGIVHIWNGSNGSCDLLEGHTHGIFDLAFSPDGSVLATASNDCTAVASNDCTVRLWRLDDSSCRILEGLTEAVSAIAFSPDGLSLASGSCDGSIRFWNVSDGSSTSILRTEEHLGHMFCIAFSPDGKTLASAGDGPIIIWSVSDDGNWSPAIITNEQEGAVLAVAYSPDGRYLASGGADHSVRLWDTFDGSQKYVLEGHTDDVDSVCFSPDGKILASASSDKSVRLWNVEDGNY
jgi:WD40 repeat protein